MFDFNGSYSSLFLLQAVQLKQNRAASMTESQYFRARSRAARGGWIRRAVARWGGWRNAASQPARPPVMAATQQATAAPPRRIRANASFSRPGDSAAFTRPATITDRAA